jgi:hypothetical protein
MTDELQQGQVVGGKIINPGIAAVPEEKPKTLTSSSTSEVSSASGGKESSFSAEKTFSPDEKSDPLQAILRGERVSSQEKALPSEIVDVSKAALERALVLYQKATDSKATDSSVKQFLDTYLAPLLPKNKDGTVNIDILKDPNNISSIVEEFISETKEQGIFLGLAFAQREYEVLANAYTITQKAIEPAFFPDPSKVMYSFEGGVGFEINPSTGAITFKYGEPIKMTYEQYLERLKKETLKKNLFYRWLTSSRPLTKEQFELIQSGKKGEYTFEFGIYRQPPQNSFDKFYLEQIGLLEGNVLRDPRKDPEVIKFLGRRVMEIGTVVQEYLKATGVPENQRIEKIKKIISGREFLFSQQQVQSVKNLIEQEIENAQKEAKRRIENTRNQEMVEVSRTHLLARKKLLEEEIEKRKQEEEKRKQETGLLEEDKDGLLGFIEGRLKRIDTTVDEQFVRSLLLQRDQLTYQITQLEAENQANQSRVQQINEELKDLRAALIDLRKRAGVRKITQKDSEGNVFEQEINKEDVLEQIRAIEGKIRNIEESQEIKAIGDLAQRKKELARINSLLSQRITFNGQTKTVEEWLGLLGEQGGESKEGSTEEPKSSEEPQKKLDDTQGGESKEGSAGKLKSLEELQKELDDIEMLLEITDPERQGEIAQRQAEVDSFATTYLDEEGLNEFIINNPLLAKAIGLNENILKDQQSITSAKNRLQLVYVLFGKEAILGGADREERIKKIINFLSSSGEPLLRDIKLSELRMKIDEIRLEKVKSLRSNQEQTQ